MNDLTDVEASVDQNTVEPWYIVGCLRCAYSGHTPRPATYCPNDGSLLLRMEGLVAGWDVVELARAAVAVHQVATEKRRADAQLASALNLLKSRTN